MATTFKVSFKVDNAAFEGAPEVEAARILREIADKIEAGQFSGAVMDVNGNKVGHFG